MGLGMPEVVLILVIALIVFGPRKLPELGKSLGQAMQQFRRASEDFKRTWEQEVDLDKIRKSDGTTSSSSHDYNAGNNYNDPYNPYGSETDSSHQPAALASESQTGSNAVSNNAEQEIAKTEAVAAGAGANSAGTATESKQKHWI
ncbi:MAG: twin-arginine translocase TatA/TatE family subunit [Acidobacteriota bacterium]